jgi:hypothetical protein
MGSRLGVLTWALRESLLPWARPATNRARRQEKWVVRAMVAQPEVLNAGTGSCIDQVEGGGAGETTKGSQAWGGRWTSRACRLPLAFRFLLYLALRSSPRCLYSTAALGPSILGNSGVMKICP